MPAPEYRDDPEPDDLVEIEPASEEYLDHDVESQTDRSNPQQPPSGPSEASSAVPLWLQESAATFKYKWVPLPLRRAGRAVVRWVKGPVPPEELEIKPLFPRIQEAPIKLLDRFIPKRRHRISLLIVFYAAWFLTWSLMLKHLSTAGFIEGYGKPQNLWCGASVWNDDNGCGLSGNDCRPFAAVNKAFRCPANCAETKLLNPHVVGNESYIYQGMVIGGPQSDPHAPAVYRGDSWICQAAIHAGVIRNDIGGCGIVSYIGEYGNFQNSTHHGIKSLAFPATFPKAYYFPDPSEYNAQCPADSRWGVFAVTAVFLTVLSLFTTSPLVFFFSTFFITSFHVGMVSDPPPAPDFSELLSTFFGRLLPASFVAAIFYRIAARPLLTGLTAQVEKTVLYLGFCIIGALNNYTFAAIIPIARLTPHDLAEPGAIRALVIIVTIILLIVASQIYWIRKSGNLPKYLAIYVSFCLGLVILLALPHMRLRIHHYILAMLFMPGTAFKVRPSLAYQGLLLGLFINGAMRWGFDSIIQTPAALGEVGGGGGGGGGGSWWGAQSPNVTAIVSSDASNITFRWGSLPAVSGVDGVSILVNDVERWRGYTDDELFWDQSRVTLTRQRPFINEPEPEFYRFAWMNGRSTGRYSKVGTWDVNDVWHPIPGTVPYGHT